MRPPLFWDPPLHPFDATGGGGDQCLDTGSRSVGMGGLRPPPGFGRSSVEGVFPFFFWGGGVPRK